MLNVCLICSALLIVKVIFVITVLFPFLLSVSTILVNKDDHYACALHRVHLL